MDKDRSRKKFAECVRSIIEEDGGRLDALWFEDNGKFARVSFYWETQEQKTHIVFDLEGEEALDLLTPEEVDDLVRERLEDC